MKHLNWHLIGIVLLMWTVSHVGAQSNSIEIGAVIEDRVTASDIVTYELVALETTVISIHVEALDTGLDPMVRLLDNSGNAIYSNDDYNYPDNQDAIIQAFVIPRTGTYIIEVSGFGDTSGAFRLSLLPGFDTLIAKDTITSDSNWESVGPELMSVTSNDGMLLAQIEGIAVTDNLIVSDFPEGLDYYYEATFSQITSTTSWQVGILFRYVDENLHYRLVMNDQGFWQMEWVNGETNTVVQSWSTHPAIVPGAPNFTLGILASGASFDIIYNNQLIATVYDDNIMQAGGTGVTATTANALSSRVTFAIESAIMTTPTRIDGQLLFPARLVANNSTALAHILERQQVIPVRGSIKLTATESTIRNVNPGVSRFPVASSLEFSEFVMGVTISWEQLGSGVAGCGITFNDLSGTNYTLAYVTSSGEYGISKRDGDIFTEGIYSADLPQNSTSYSLIIVVTADQLYYYINNEFMGAMPYQPVGGAVNTAVVNFDGVDTSCTFDNLWLWSLDDIAGE